MVNELLQKSPVVLKIQVEVAVEKKKLIDTRAGQSINEALMQLSKKHVEDLALIKEDIAQAVKESKYNVLPPTKHETGIEYTNDHFHRGRRVAERARSYQAEACRSDESNREE